MKLKLLATFGCVLMAFSANSNEFEHNRAIFIETLEISKSSAFPETTVELVTGESAVPEMHVALKTQVVVSSVSSFVSARELARRGLKPLVLDMANSTSPGGSPFEGSKAQEETLCRQSNLYPALLAAQGQGLYPLAEAGGVLVKNVTFFRDDAYKLAESFQVDVFATAAYDCNVKHKPDPAKNLCGYNRPEVEAHYLSGTKAKMRAIFRAAKLNGNQTIVLSALGCGAFANDPKTIATLFKEVLREVEFDRVFSEIHFAIAPVSSANFVVFNETFSPQR